MNITILLQMISFVDLLKINTAKKINQHFSWELLFILAVLLSNIAIKKVLV